MARRKKSGDRKPKEKRPTPKARYKKPATKSTKTPKARYSKPKSKSLGPKRSSAPPKKPTEFERMLVRTKIYGDTTKEKEVKKFLLHREKDNLKHWRNNK